MEWEQWNEIRVAEWNGNSGMRVGISNVEYQWNKTERMHVSIVNIVDSGCMMGHKVHDRKVNLGHGESEEVVRLVRFQDEMVPRIRDDGILCATLVGRVLL